MKKLMLTIASLLFVSIMAVNAQVSTDTTSVSGQPSQTDQSNYTRDMEAIQSSEVPASLRSTLQGSEYSGWEEGKVYRNSTTNEYLIVIGDEDAKVYRFDANGSRIEDTPADSNTTPNSGSGTTGSGSTNDSMNSGSTSGSTDSGSSTSGSTNSGSTSGSTSSGSTSGSTGTTGSGSTTPAPADK
jgi:hypothetical protein